MLRLGAVVPVTEAEGPGKRFAVWVRGCSIRCPGCCNPHLFAPEGEGTSVARICERLDVAAREHGLEGITLLGGEPFEQAAPLAIFAAHARACGLGVITFTGYAYQSLASSGDAGTQALLGATDLLVDGPFLRNDLDGARKWVGSNNQRFIHLTHRYPADLEWPHGRLERTVELRISPSGDVHMSGWPEGLATPRAIFRSRR